MFWFIVMLNKFPSDFYWVENDGIVKEVDAEEEEEEDNLKLRL